jgi:hypothetical protein
MRNIEEIKADMETPASRAHDAVCAKINRLQAELHVLQCEKAGLEDEIERDWRDYCAEHGVDVEGFTAKRTEGEGGEPVVVFVGTPGQYYLSTLLAHEAPFLCFHLGMGRDYGITRAGLTKALHALFTLEERAHWRAHGMAARLRNALA